MDPSSWEHGQDAKRTSTVSRKMSLLALKGGAMGILQLPEAAVRPEGHNVVLASHKSLYLSSAYVRGRRLRAKAGE